MASPLAALRSGARDAVDLADTPLPAEGAARPPPRVYLRRDSFPRLKKSSAVLPKAYLAECHAHFSALPPTRPPARRENHARLSPAPPLAHSRFEATTPASSGSYQQYGHPSVHHHVTRVHLSNARVYGAPPSPHRPPPPSAKQPTLNTEHQTQTHPETTPARRRPKNRGPRFIQNHLRLMK